MRAKHCFFQGKLLKEINMERLIRLLHKYATGNVVLVLFTLTMAVYLAMLLYSIPAVVSFAPGMMLFDLSPTGYTFEYAVARLEALGAEGRATYLTTQLPLDFIYPGLFAVTYSLLLTWLFRKGADHSSKIYYFSLVPIAAGLFDYIENVLTKYKYTNLAIVYMLYDYVHKLKENSGKVVRQLEYSKFVGSLMYAINCTRPDKAIAMMLSRFTNNSGKEHWIAIKRVMTYLKGTMHYALHFTNYPSVIEGI